MNEVWKDIKGFEGLYQVSNYGRVKSSARLIIRTTYGKDSSYPVPEKIRAQGLTRGGYLFVPLTKNGKSYGKRVNRLVAQAFLPDYSEEKEVHHIDGDITNNAATNLECLSAKEHHDEHANWKGVRGIKGDEVLVFKKIGDVAEKGFDPPNVARCCKAALLPEGHPRRKKYATHKGYFWEYTEESKE